MDSRLGGGKYEIIRKIGEGGAADVFLAYSTFEKRNVALKIPSENCERIYNSLVTEYLFATRHCHPALLKPRTLFFESTKPIIVTPYLEGLTLDEYADSIKTGSKTGPDLQLLKQLFAGILECAEFIHFSGYLYNDFKPSNIIVHGHKRDEALPDISLIDFNLITASGERPKRQGTLHYLAPEIIIGSPPAPASDIYSIGALFYQLIAGTPPFDSSSSSELISLIPDSGSIDFRDIPESLCPGISSMLNRDPALRPNSALQAAKILGIEDYFEALMKSRTEFYLASGLPPFASELKERFDQFRKSARQKIFLIYGYSYSTTALNFLESEYGVQGNDCIRISDPNDDRRVRRILDEIISAINPNLPEKIILIENLESLGHESLRKLAEIIKKRQNISVAALGGRWFKPDTKYEIFDPLVCWSGMHATEVSLKTFLKQDCPHIDCRELCESTGGDPEQIFNSLKHIGRRNGLDFHRTGRGKNIFYKTPSVPENEYIYKRIFDSLGTERQDLISILSAWGNSIPLLMFVKFEGEKREIIESLIRPGFLIRCRDSVSFISGGFREYVYGRIPEAIRESYHKFWASASEELISDDQERLELSAHHWALSGDIERSYDFNESAATEFYKNGDYIKARKFGKTLIEFKAADPARRKTALKINGDICRAMGYFRTARKMYLGALRGECDPKAKAEIRKELGELYLFSGDYTKSLMNTGVALAYYKKIEDRKNAEKCRSAMCLALYGKKEYIKVLEYIGKPSENYKDENGFSDVGYINNPNNGPEKRKIIETILEISISSKNSDLTARSYIELAKIGLGDGDLDGSAVTLRNAVESSEKSGNKNRLVDSLLYSGLNYFLSGDLFMAIECFQNSGQIAESIGNIYLKAAAEIRLVDVSMAMGNYSLADDLLAALENDDIYNEDKLLRLKIDLRRARLCLVIGDLGKSSLLAEQISKSAQVMGKQRLALKADIIGAESHGEISKLNYLERLKIIYSRSKKCGFADLVSETQLLLGEYYLDNVNRHNASYYLEEILAAGAAAKATKLEAAIYMAEISAENDKFGEAVETLIETESIAAASGYIPVALNAAETLGRLYGKRGRADLCEDCSHRADGYLEKLMSAVPRDYPAENYRKKLILSRAGASGRTRIPEKSPAEKKPIAAKIS